METTTLLDWAKFALQFLAVVLIPALVWLARRLNRADHAIARHEAQMKADATELSIRLVRLESKLETLPSAQAVHQLELAISDLAGQIKTAHERDRSLGRSLDIVRTTLERQQRYLETNTVAPSAAKMS